MEYESETLLQAFQFGLLESDLLFWLLSPVQDILEILDIWHLLWATFLKQWILLSDACSSLIVVSEVIKEWLKKGFRGYVSYIYDVCILLEYNYNMNTIQYGYIYKMMYSYLDSSTYNISKSHLMALLQSPSGAIWSHWLSSDKLVLFVYLQSSLVPLPPLPQYLPLLFS
jgi:hypothetical protein